VLPNFVRQALRDEPITVFGTGRQTRCFADVSDAVESIVRIATSPGAIGEIINIGNDQEISINALAALVKEQLGSRSEIVHLPYEQVYGPGFEDMHRRVPNLEKLERLTGYRPRILLTHEMLRILLTHEMLRILLTHEMLRILLTHEMLRIHVELRADILVNLPVGKQRVGSLERVRLRERLRIVHRDLNFQMPQIRTAVPLDNMQRVAMRQALAVQPSLVIEPDRVHHQSVAVPLGHGIAHP
jgi:hypothetical protein